MIQVCYDIEDPDTKQRELKALTRASSVLDCSDLLVVTWDYEGEEMFNDMKIVYRPLWKWLLD